MVGRVPREHVGQAGFDADADQCQPPGLPPLLLGANCSSPSLTPVSRTAARDDGCDRLIAMSR